MSARLVARAAPPADLLLAGAHVLDPRGDLDGAADVLIREGEIAQLGAAGSLDAPEGVEAIDARGCHLVPGFVDPHVHLRVPGQEHKETLETGTRAAAAGGFVAILGMPNTTPPIDSAPALRSLLEIAESQAHIPTGFMPAITQGMGGERLTEMAELREVGAVGFTDDGLPVESAGLLRRALQYQRLVGGVLALHEEDMSLAGDGVMHEGDVSAVLGLSGIPSIAESTPIARDAAIAAYEGGRIHHMHLSCAESVAAVAEAKARGARVSAEVCPHHLTLTDEDARALDTSMKMNPPLRSAADRDALIGALRDGTIDCIATDHAPHARHEKEVPWEQAPMGTTGLETAFAALHTELVAPGVLPLSLLIARMSDAAALFDLPTPRIAIGEPANLALLDLESTWEVGADGYQSRSENCCFAARTLTGRVVLTLARGAVAHRLAERAGVPA